MRVLLLTLAVLLSPVVTAEAPAVSIKNAKAPLENVLSGGQPTEQELREAAAAGFKTVINLRGLAEEGAWDEKDLVESLGMRFVHLPVESRSAINDDSVDALWKVLEDADAHPVLLHCGSGNRVGALFALKAFGEGKSIDDALAAGREAGMTKLEPYVEELLRGRSKAKGQ